MFPSFVGCGGGRGLTSSSSSLSSKATPLEATPLEAWLSLAPCEEEEEQGAETLEGGGAVEEEGAETLEGRGLDDVTGGKSSSESSMTTWKHTLC